MLSGTPCITIRARQEKLYWARVFDQRRNLNEKAPLFDMTAPRATGRLTCTTGYC